MEPADLGFGIFLGVAGIILVMLLIGVGYSAASKAYEDAGCHMKRACLRGHHEN